MKVAGFVSASNLSVLLRQSKRCRLHRLVSQHTAGQNLAPNQLIPDRTNSTNVVHYWTLLCNIVCFNHPNWLAGSWYTSINHSTSAMDLHMDTNPSPQHWTVLRKPKKTAVLELVRIFCIFLHLATKLKLQQPVSPINCNALHVQSWRKHMTTVGFWGNVSTSTTLFGEAQQGHAVPHGSLAHCCTLTSIAPTVKLCRLRLQWALRSCEFFQRHCMQLARKHNASCVHSVTQHKKILKRNGA